MEWVGQNRKKGTLDGFFRSLTAEEGAAVEAVVLYMWGPFIASIQSLKQ